MLFAKPYKLKSNNSLKNSEKKHLAQRLQDEFPSIAEEKIKEIVPAKSNCICMKLILCSGTIVNVYAVDGIPMVIETQEGLVPTVCALWKISDLIPTIAIHSPVLPKVQGGAPLYLPGVHFPPGGAGFPIFQRGAIIGVHTVDNIAAGIIGRATMSSADMLLRAAGVCLDTLHVYGDQLCKDSKFGKIERPKLGPYSHGYVDGEDNISAGIQELIIQPQVRDEWPTLGKPNPKPDPAPVPNEPRIIPDTIKQTNQNDDSQNQSDNIIVTEDSQSESDIPTDMDGLLRWCLLSFLKLEGKSVELPIKTSLLYRVVRVTLDNTNVDAFRNHMIPLCPPELTLDVKKSTYKKVGKFLEAMQKEGLIEVREVEKGVDAVTAVSVAHAAVRAHRAPAPSAPGVRPQCADSAPGDEYAPPAVRELHCVTAAVTDLFAPIKKGTAITASEVRSRLTDYVKKHNLNSAQLKDAVTLDALLAKILGKQEQENIKWDALMSGVQDKMTASTEMRFSDGTHKLVKTKLEPIKMQVATRSGNKKVTLVSNLESFGFSLAGLSQTCQRGVAASCTITRSPGAKYDQLLLQGDQTHFVAKLLIEKYGLPKKFVEGADKALNKKKN